MTAQLIDGKSIAKTILNEVKDRSEKLQSRGIIPTLGIVAAAGDPAGDSYRRMRKKAASKAGIELKNILVENSHSDDSGTALEVNRQAWYAAIKSLASDDKVHGILIQAPLPKGLEMMELASLMPPEKDIDGQHPSNQGALLALKTCCFAPCTPSAAIEVLRHSDKGSAGSHIVVLGRSQVVGLPLSLMLLKRGTKGDATVTVCHTKTPDIGAYTRQADIVITAAGAPGCLKGDMIKEGAVLIDVGMTSIEDSSKKSGWRLSGDVDIESCMPVASMITPTPGGTGPVTTAISFRHTILAAENFSELT